MAQCPTSASYHAEVRGGETQVEQYVAPGWQPTGLVQQFLRAGYAQLDGEYVNDGLYEAFLDKAGRRVYLLATRQGEQTVLTLNGSP